MAGTPEEIVRRQGRSTGVAAGLAACVAVIAVACGGPARDWPEVEGVRHHQHELEGRRWHWVEAGAGPTVVLLHGVPESWHAWHHVIPLLAADHRVIAPDLDGFGASEPANGSHAFCAVAERLAPVLDEIAPEGYHLVGQDWGAFVGACLAVARPEAVHTYTHVAAPIDRYDLTRLPDYRDFYLTPEAIDDLMRNVELFVTRVYDAGIHGGSEALDPGLLERRISEFRGKQDALARYFEDLDLDRRWRLQGESRAAWDSLEVPVTIVIGDRDLLVPQELFLDAADRIPGFRQVVVIDDAAHFPAEEQPEQFVATLREAFDR